MSPRAHWVQPCLTSAALQEGLISGKAAADGPEHLCSGGAPSSMPQPAACFLMRAAGHSPNGPCDQEPRGM